MNWPKVSIISVNYNQADHTIDLIESLLRITYSNFEIIMVDNGSEDNQLSIKIQQFPGVIFIHSKKNLGFSGGNNLGLKYASGDYILFINNDTIVDIHFLEPLVSSFLENKKVGIVSPKIMYYNTNFIQYAGSGKINPFTGRSVRKGYKVKDIGQFNIKTKTQLVHGAAMMVSKEVVKKVGPLPEIYFLYYEEIDWCETIKKAGYEAWYIPESKIYHKESISVGKDSQLKTYYINRNRILFLRRHTKGIHKLSWILFYTFLTIPKNVIKYSLRMDFNNLKAFLGAIYWNLSNCYKPK